MLYIVALQFCNGKKNPNINVYKLQSVLTLQNADVAETSVGVTYLRFMHHIHLRMANKPQHVHVIVEIRNTILAFTKR